MGNKQGELEICVQSEGYDLTAIIETRWDSSHDFNAVMEIYILFQKGSMVKPGVDLYCERPTRMLVLPPGRGRRMCGELVGEN